MTRLTRGIVIGAVAFGAAFVGFGDAPQPAMAAHHKHHKGHGAGDDSPQPACCCANACAPKPVVQPANTCSCGGQNCGASAPAKPGSTNVPAPKPAGGDADNDN